MTIIFRNFFVFLHHQLIIKLRNKTKLKSYERNEKVFWNRIIGSAHDGLFNIQLFAR